MENITEEKQSFQEVLKDFQNGLKNAEMENQDTISQSSDFVPTKLAVKFPNIVVRFVCDFKNRIATKLITKDMPKDDRDFVLEYLKADDDEIKIYSQVLEIGGTEFLPENYKEWLNKWLLNPFFLTAELLLEYEVKKLLGLRRELKLRDAKKGSE